jgi:hypothetical protein
MTSARIGYSKWWWVYFQAALFGLALLFFAGVLVASAVVAGRPLWLVGLAWLGVMGAGAFYWTVVVPKRLTADGTEIRWESLVSHGSAEIKDIVKVEERIFPPNTIIHFRDGRKLQAIVYGDTIGFAEVLQGWNPSIQLRVGVVRRRMRHKGDGLEMLGARGVWDNRSPSK